MKVTQAKLKEALERQTFKTFDKLTEALDTAAIVQMEEEPAEHEKESTSVKGENKVLVSKRPSRKRKHSYRMKAVEKKKPERTKKSKPRFFCQF